MTDSYDLTRLSELRCFLESHGTFKFAPLRTHLFPAAVVTRSTRQSGYQHVWVRDNIHVSHALYINGNVRAAAETMSAMMQFFARRRHRFEDVIDGKVKRTDPMSRPHVRFNGETLQESPEIWAHAQNDALGCFLWMYCTLASENIMQPSRNDVEMLTIFPLYFDAIRYWADEDSGHWEETRKIEASSIGAVVAGLAKLRTFLSDGRARTDLSGRSSQVSDSFMKALERRGRNELNSILPYECAQTSSAKKRRYDGALLFLVYPLEVVGDAMGTRILRDIAENLEGPYGIKRYVGDSYWAADYKDKLDPAKRTADFSHGVGMRNKLLAPGQETQWCLFDPIMSAAYGRKYHRTGRKNISSNRLTISTALWASSRARPRAFMNSNALKRTIWKEADTCLMTRLLYCGRRRTSWWP